MNETDLLKYIRTPQFVRESCMAIYREALEGRTHFQLHEDRLEACAKFVLDVIHNNYPKLNIPFHSRWGHLNVGQKENPSIQRLEKLNASLKSLSPRNRAKAKWDFIIPSVLLDAGAGMAWRYHDKEHNQFFSKSEGLALASLDLYYANYFRNGQSLATITPDVLNKFFQVSPQNPLLGIEGRAKLMQKLGTLLSFQPHLFPNGRLGDLIDVLVSENQREISAPDVLILILNRLSSIWPSRLEINHESLGDVWEYKPLSKVHPFYVAFHKLSQWLTYSLLEPLEEMGLKVNDVEQLTGLCEYRNGGLFLDFGVVSLRDPALATQEHAADSPLILEWRALTLCLLDKIAPLVQAALNKNPQEFPLAKVLEGGTWWAGRKIAREKRADGGPPLLLKSDGTVF
jgi:hypothetical protein